MSKSLFPIRYTSKEAAMLLGVTESTLAVWRCTKRYPLPYLKMGSKVFYLENDLKAFIDSRLVNQEAPSCL